MIRVANHTSDRAKLSLVLGGWSKPFSALSRDLSTRAETFRDTTHCAFCDVDGLILSRWTLVVVWVESEKRLFFFIEILVDSIRQGRDPREAIQKTQQLCCCFFLTGSQASNCRSMRPTLSTIERDAIIARLGADGLLACQCLPPCYHYIQVHFWQGPYELIDRSDYTSCSIRFVKHFAGNGLRELAIVNMSVTSSTSAIAQDGNNLITKSLYLPTSWL